MAANFGKPCVALSELATSDMHGEDSAYFAGWRAYDEDPYDVVGNPSGVIQMGLAENQVSLQSPQSVSMKLQEIIEDA